MGKRGKNKSRHHQQQQQQQSSQQQRSSQQHRRSRHADDDEEQHYRQRQRHDGSSGGGAAGGDPPRSDPIKIPTTPPDLTKPPLPPWHHFAASICNGALVLAFIAAAFETAALLLWLFGVRAAPPPLRATWRWFINPRGSWLALFGTLVVTAGLAVCDMAHVTIATLTLAPLSFHLAGGGVGGFALAAAATFIEGLVVTESEASSRLFFTCELAALTGFVLVPRNGWLRWLVTGCLVSFGAWLCLADADCSLKAPLSGFWHMGETCPYNKTSKDSDRGAGRQLSPAVRAARRAAAAEPHEQQFRGGFRPQPLPRGVVNEAVRQVLMASDYYSVLGAPRNAEVDVLRRARNQMSLRVHSDRAGGEGHEAMQRVNEAWNALRDQRAAYDRALSEVESAEEESHPATQWDDDSPELTGVTQMLYRGRLYDTPYFFNVQYRWCSSCLEWHRLQPGDEWVWESGTFQKYRKVLRAFLAEEMFSGGPAIWQGRLVVIDCTRVYGAMQDDAAFPSLIFRLPAFAHRAHAGALAEVMGGIVQEEMQRRAEEALERRLRARERYRYR